MAFHACFRANRAGGLAPTFHSIFAAAPSCQVEHVGHQSQTARAPRSTYHEHCTRRQAVVLTCLTGSQKSAAARSTLSSAVKARLSVRCSRRWVCSYYRYDGHVIRPLLAARCHGDACEWTCRSGTKLSCFRRRDSSSFVAGGQRVKLKKRELDRILEHFHIKASAHSATKHRRPGMLVCVHTGAPALMFAEV